MFTVCVLLYGDYPELAKRVLGSISSTHLVGEVRLGLNAVSEATFSFAQEWAAEKSASVPVKTYRPSGNKNVGKYPLMSRMFVGLRTSHVMWFDDDSFLVNAVPEWWQTVLSHAALFDVYGSLHRIKQRGNQYLAIPQQSWFGGKPVSPRHVYDFATGGWWVGNVGFLRKWGYPFPQLQHNGGDSVLGELVRQQGAKLGHASTSVAVCYCEACAKVSQAIRSRPIGGVNINVGGRAGRRGIGVSEENYVFSDGNPFPSLLHHSFDVEVLNYGV
jgi:hypothetical protein